MRDLSDVGLDSNCLSYVIQSMEGVTEPKGDLAEQKVALVRLYLYTPGTLWTPARAHLALELWTRDSRWSRSKSPGSIYSRPEAVS